jgi:hypothetical protein
MKLTSALLIALVVGGCGAETATTAASGAIIKKQEIQQGQKTLEQSKAKIDQAIKLQQPRAD